MFGSNPVIPKKAASVSSRTEPQQLVQLMCYHFCTPPPFFFFFLNYKQTVISRSENTLRDMSWCVCVCVGGEQNKLVPAVMQFFMFLLLLASVLSNYDWCRKHLIHRLCSTLANLGTLWKTKKGLYPLMLAPIFFFTSVLDTWADLWHALDSSMGRLPSVTVAAFQMAVLFFWVCSGCMYTQLRLVAPS